MHINRKPISESVEDAMKNKNPNVKRMRSLKPQPRIDIVMADALEASDEFDTHTKKVFSDLEKQSEILTPKEPTTGKKVNRKPYTEGFMLNEDLFEDANSGVGANASQELLKYAQTRESETGHGYEVLRGFVEYGAKRIGQSFEDNVGKYITDRWEFPNGLWENEAEADAYDVDEALDLSKDPDFDVYSNLNSDIYNAVADVMFEYRDKGITKADLENCFEWFMEHFFDTDGEYLDEALLESKSIKENKHIQKASKKPSRLKEAKIEGNYLWQAYGEDDDEPEQDTVYDFANERLFGMNYGGFVNGGNYRATNKFCRDVWVSLIKPKGAVSSRKNFYYPDNIAGCVDCEGSTESRRAPTSEGISIYLRDESEDTLARAVADELELDYKIKPIGSYNKTNYKYIATVVIPDYIAEMPIDEYLTTIGKSISDYKGPGRGHRTKERELVAV